MFCCLIEDVMIKLSRQALIPSLRCQRHALYYRHLTNLCGKNKIYLLIRVHLRELQAILYWVFPPACQNSVYFESKLASNHSIKKHGYHETRSRISTLINKLFYHITD